MLVQVYNNKINIDIIDRVGTEKIELVQIIMLFYQFKAIS